MSEQDIRAMGKRLKAIMEESYDQDTYNHDLADFVEYALHGEILPYPKVICTGIIFKNPTFNPEYTKAHQYEHSMGYSVEEQICICGKYCDDSIHQTGIIP